jgi:hypothetical protein
MRSAELDDAVVAFLAEQSRRTAAEFGKKPGDPPLLEWGERPESRAPTAKGKSTIFVERERERADWWRIRWQIAHEVFHWRCTPLHTLHWTHEFFAVETAVLAMAARWTHRPG